MGVYVMYGSIVKSMPFTMQSKMYDCMTPKQQCRDILLSHS